MAADEIGQLRDYEDHLEHASTTADTARDESGDGRFVHAWSDPSSVEAALDAFESRVAAQRRSHLVFLDDVVEADRVELWLADGAPSMIEWLVCSHGMNRHTARATVTVAHSLADLPALRAAYATGRVSWDQLRAAVDVATPDTDAQLAALIPSMVPAEIRALARQVTETAEDEAFQDRSLRYWFHEHDPIFEMHVTMPDVEGAALITALRRRASVLDADPDDGLAYDHSVRMADALTQIASQYLAAEADHDRATLIVRTDIPTLLAGSADSDQDRLPGMTATSSRLGDGTGVPEHLTITNRTLRRLACDARIQLALEDPHDGVIGIGRTSRTIPPWLARIVRSRDQGCRFPECQRHHWLVIHHITHWADGGPTDLDNLITLCGFHHRLIHNQGWDIVGNPNHPNKNSIRWFTKWGTHFHRHPQTATMHAIRHTPTNPKPVHPPRILRDMLTDPPDG